MYQNTDNFKKIEVIIPKTEEDLERCAELDRKGKLASGDSYPTKEQLEEIEE